MKKQFVFPSIVILMYLASAITYAFSGDWRRFTYNLAAAVLTASVTF